MYRFKTIKENDLEIIREFLKETYFQDEPLSKSLTVADNMETSPLEDELYKEIEDGVSIMAVTPIGKVIGVLLASILKETDYVISTREYSNSRFDKMAKFEDYVFNEASRVILKRFPNLKKTLYVSTVAVDKAWRKNHVAFHLVEHTIREARETGFDLVRGECTSAFSTHICRQLGTECVYKLDYKDYKENGKSVLVPRAPHESVSAFVYKCKH